MSLNETLIPFALVFLVLQAPLVVCAGWFAPVIGARRWLWISVTAIPWLGLLFGYVLLFRTFGKLLDALEKRNQLQSEQHLEKRLGLRPVATQAQELDVPTAENAAPPQRLIG
jgi:hypothetical protein